MPEAVSLAAQFGTGGGIFVLLILLIYRQRDRVGSRTDEAADSMFDRLEKEIQRLTAELADERETNRLYRVAREKKDAQHRRWDSLVLRTALTGGDVARLPDPPSLTPHPSEYEPKKASV